MRKDDDQRLLVEGGAEERAALTRARRTRIALRKSRIGSGFGIDEASHAHGGWQYPDQVCSEKRSPYTSSRCGSPLVETLSSTAERRSVL